MSVGLVTLLLFSTLIILLAAGVPFAFSIAGTAIIWSFILWGSKSLIVVAVQTLGPMLSTILLAIPLFILMANFLQRSGIADDLYELIYNSLGRTKGGLAVGTVIICTLFAAMTGISGAATVTMGLIALPSMLKRNYDKKLAIGCVAAGGALGILIPPSVAMILYGTLAGVSVGKLFAGGILPGLLLGTLFIIYVLTRSHLDPHLGPAVPADEKVSLKVVLPQLRALIFPIALVIGVLGSIFAGIATPTEAAAVGALGSIICSAINRKLNISLFWDCCSESLKLTAMIMWIVIAATWFSSVYTVAGGPQFVNDIIASIGINRWAVLIAIQSLLIVLGMIMETNAIILITVPIFIPIIRMLGFNPVWFGILFIMNMEMGFLTPPFGYNLFYMKAIVPKGVTMGDIYRSIIPFVLLQLVGLVIVMIFPVIATIIPEALFGV